MMNAAARPRSLRAVRLRHFVVVVAVLASAAMIWQASESTFSATTTNPGDSWTAGSVSITDDDAGVAMFSPTGLKPTSTGSKCIAVTYTGNLASSVKLYATTYTGTLGTYLNLAIETSAVGTFASCGAFTSPTTIYNGTLAGFVGASTNFATGAGTWTPSSNPTTLAYRITYTLQDNNSAQGLASTCNFVWEAQNT